MQKYFMLFFISFCAVNIAAQDPNWSVNAANYQYSMTFTAFLSVNGNVLTTAEDKVAVFVNEELRGVAKATYVASADKYVVYLSAYANTTGELLSFKIYNSIDQTIYDVAETLTFIIDGNVGGISQTYSVASPALSNEAVLNSFSFLGVTAVSESINDRNIAIVLPFDTDLSSLIAVYVVSTAANFFVENTLQVSGTTVQDFTNSVSYKLKSENEATLVEYIITVTIENATIALPEIVLKSDASVNVKQVPILINIEINVAVVGFSQEDISLTNAVISSFKKESDLLYKLEIVPIQQGIFSIEILENLLFNSNNGANLASNKLTFNYDIVRPYLLSIKRNNPTQEITEDNILEFRVVFNEAVENVKITDFESVTNATFTILKESNSSYNIRVAGLENYVGTVSLNLNIGNSIQDKSGNLLLNSIINAHQN